MKRYIISLTITTLLLVIVSLIVAVVNPTNFRTVLPFTAVYFGIVTLVEHFFIVSSAKKSPRTFIKNLLGGSVAVLILHLFVMAAWMFTHHADAKVFIVGFCICYMLYLAFETIALCLFVRCRRKESESKVPADKPTE